jgi:2-C-methyl-D-erythritol 2,4-cyclodiphosphate synthase
VSVVCTGIGYDCHQFADGRPLIIGGIEIPCERGLLGHSDADVLVHAVIDALLGAAGLGDIGQHFPDTDPAFAGADSMGLLAACRELLEGAGVRVLNVDATVVLEEPKLAPFKGQMRARLAGGLGLEVAFVNVKATRGEGMGFIGRGEGAATLAIATVER